MDISKYHYYQHYSKQHPEFVLHVSVNAPQRGVGQQVSMHFHSILICQKLEETKENRLHGKPGQIFHMDDSTLPLDPKSPIITFLRRASTSQKLTCFLCNNGGKVKINFVAYDKS